MKRQPKNRRHNNERPEYCIAEKKFRYRSFHCPGLKCTKEECNDLRMQEIYVDLTAKRNQTSEYKKKTVRIPIDVNRFTKELMRSFGINKQKVTHARRNGYVVLNKMEASPMQLQLIKRFEEGEM